MRNKKILKRRRKSIKRQFLMEDELGEGKNKVTITTRLDRDLLDWAKAQAKLEDEGYQTWINGTLRKLKEGQVQAEHVAKLEEMLGDLKKELAAHKKFNEQLAERMLKAVGKSKPVKTKRK